MSLLGIKDISSLRTPPEERKPILTKVTAFSDKVIRHAVRHELSRNGQVFFVHNRVYNIDYYLNYIRDLAPEARVGKVHGQMDEKEIEENMKRFLRNDIDVLVCTTIIESGIDLPNVNTLIINNANNFGLADLHQLRGRVGRFTRQAYAYLLIPQADPISDEAAKRLKTIERYSELGAGFKIALQDLEIRGAGNILGAEQSGHIAAIGYDLYCKILESVIKRKQGEQAENPFDKGPEIDLPVSAFIPSGYIRDFRLKIEIYRKIEETDTLAAADQVRKEIEDRFGPCPPEVNRLLILQKISMYAKEQGIEYISVQKKHASIAFQKADAPVRIELPPEAKDQDSLCEWILKILKNRVEK
jgi:transcription-repair coupling factor (superfamily II helicase)